MSFARKLLTSKKAAEGLSEVSIIPHIEKAVVSIARVSYDKDKCKEAAEKYLKCLQEGKEHSETLEAFEDLQRLATAPVSRRTGVVSPSKFYDECLRKMYYSATRTPITDPNAGRPNSGLQMIFDVGTWYHTYIQNALQKSGILKASEVNVTSLKYRVAGSADGIVVLDGVEYLLEIKTINTYSFSKLTVKPLEHHIFQASIYASLLKLDKIIFLYIDKNTSKLLEFIVNVDEKAVATYQKKALLLRSHIDKGEAPERDCSDRFIERALECQFCTHCFKSK